ncbi:hypothetical protein TrLO_g6986 [Triparma laevis f. longispina]|uniref:Tyrosine-protein kinase ephrin type A/B receptor-like domain-containing protein n=1 Tax=Triparma laevis f. longispina TaxID=1714387 RepID=A0A9W7FBF0_9STRA|nr:hypothetical protein TrLO_g6986 [Triparma laevis f. longispina]
MVQSICILGFIILSIMSDWDEYWATATADVNNDGVDDLVMISTAGGADLFMNPGTQASGTDPNSLGGSYNTPSSVTFHPLTTSTPLHPSILLVNNGAPPPLSPHPFLIRRFAPCEHVNSCPAGKSFSDGVCTDCLAGMYKPGPGLTCSSCQPRLLHKHYKRGGHGPCQLCGQGKYLDFTGAVAETQCKLCPLGPITLSTTILF